MGQIGGLRPKISLIVPVYNEQGAIKPFVATVELVIASLEISFDILIGRRRIVGLNMRGDIEIARSGMVPIRLIALSRNFGKEAALTAGLDAATGDAVIPIDVDLQDPPEIIPLFIDYWRMGYKVVYGRRMNRLQELLCETTDFQSVLYRV